jgi:hypothetical protein
MKSSKKGRLLDEQHVATFKWFAVTCHECREGPEKLKVNFLDDLKVWAFKPSKLATPCQEIIDQKASLKY